MVTHNFYKLLKIDRNASASEIKKAYRQIALEFHPDKNPEQEGSENYFKIITQGYNILSDPTKKLEYDFLLDLAQSKEKEAELLNRRTHKLTKEQVRNKLLKVEEERKKESIALYRKRERLLNHKFRYIIIALMLLSGYLFSYNNWFINEAGYDITFVVFGYLIYILSIFFASNHLYLQLKALSFMGKFKKSFESLVIGFFLLMFFGGPISLFAANTIKKSYHLNNYAVYLYPKQYSFDSYKIYYSFSSGGKMIHKSQVIDKESEVDILKKKTPVVKFSKYNPKIATLVFVEKASE